MRLLRRVHLYLGCFFAPLLLFYLGTGWYQTFNINRNKNTGEAETLVAKLRSVHVDQVYPAASANSFSPALYRICVAVMAAAMIVTVVIGIVLALQTMRRRWLVWLSLGLGVLVPALFLWFGQKQ